MVDMHKHFPFGIIHTMILTSIYVKRTSAPIGGWKCQDEDGSVTFRHFKKLLGDRQTDRKLHFQNNQKHINNT